MGKIPKNDMLSHIQESKQQIVKRVLEALNQKEQVNLFWYVYGQKDGATYQRDYWIRTSRELALEVGEEFRKAGYFVYICKYNDNYTGETHVLISKTPKSYQNIRKL